MLTFEDIDTVYPVESLLSSLGATKIKDRGDYIQFSSPFREDKNPSMVMYKSSLFCIDFASGYRKSLFTLVKEISGRSLFKYANIDYEEMSSHIYANSLNDGNKSKDRSTFPKRKKSVKIEGILRKVEEDSAALEYCERRNLSKKFRDKFDIRFMKNGRINGTMFTNRLCIPIVEEGKKVSMEGRDITGESKPKVLYPKGGSVSTLFNIDNLDKKRTLVVVEGIMDMPKIWESVTKNVTTTFGIMITSRQQQVLKEFEDVILMPDGDEAGERMIESFDEFYEGEFRIARLVDKDPGDTTIEEIKLAIKEAVPVTHYFLERSPLFEEPESFNLFDA